MHHDIFNKYKIGFLYIGTAHNATVVYLLLLSYCLILPHAKIHLMSNICHKRNGSSTRQVYVIQLKLFPRGLQVCGGRKQDICFLTKEKDSIYP